MRKTKNLETLIGLQCVCPTPSFRSGLDQAISLSKEFLRENCGGYLDELELEIDEDKGNLVVRWSIRAPIDELTYTARSIQSITGREANLPPSDIANIKLQMVARIPMFEISESTGYADGQKMRCDFSDSLKRFAETRETENWNIRNSIFNPLAKSFSKQ